MRTSFIQSGPRYVPTLLELTVGLGLPTPACCLDSGDIASWPGSGQRWNDVSGNNNHFFLGTSASVEGGGIEPVFRGTPGGRSENEYFDASAVDATAIFTAEVPGLFVPFHKDNNLFTIATIWRNPPGAATYPALWGTLSGVPEDGMGLALDSPTRAPQFQTDPTVGAGGQTTRASVNASAASALSIFTIASDEATLAGRMQLDQNAVETFAAPASSNTNNPSKTFTIGRKTLAGGMPIGMRFYGFVVWTSALNATQIAQFNKYAKELRFPSSP